jgi:hypothetical protein
MISRHPRASILGALVAQVGRPSRGFCVTQDFRGFRSSAAPDAPERGDCILRVDGGSPATLRRHVVSGGPIRYEPERAGRRIALAQATQPFTRGLVLGHFGVFCGVFAIMLTVGIAVFAQNSRASGSRAGTERHGAALAQGGRATRAHLAFEVGSAA